MVALGGLQWAGLLDRVFFLGPYETDSHIPCLEKSGFPCCYPQPLSCWMWSHPTPLIQESKEELA